MSPRSSFLNLISLLVLPLGAVAQESRFVDRVGGLTGWSWEEEGVLLQQVQRSPAQVRQLLEGRGFDHRQVGETAAQCAFELLLSNSGDTEIEVDLESWRIDTGQGRQPLAIGPLWRAHDRPEAGGANRIDVQWSFFPLRQAYFPTDWSSGLVVYPLPPGGRFDLYFTWSKEGKAHSGLLRGQECAAE